MRSFVAILFIFISYTAIAKNCSNKVDKNKIIFFIDTNDSKGEREAASKAACERGESFVSIPSETSIVESSVKIASIRKKIDQIRVELHECFKLPVPAGSFVNKICDDIMTRIDNEYSAIKEIKNKLGINQKLISDTIKGFSSKDKAITSVIVSGHDGGGRFHGDIGETDKVDITNALNDAYKSKPQLLSQLSSIYFVGMLVNGAK